MSNPPSLPKSILLVRLSSFGDVLLTTPLLRKIKARFPTARIDFAVAEEFSELVENNPAITSIIKISKSDNAFSGWNVLRSHRNEFLGGKKYDLLIDLHNNLRSTVLHFGHAKKVMTVKSYRREKLELVREKNRARPIPHVVDRGFEMLQSIGVSDDGGGLEYFPRSTFRVSTDSSRVRIAIAPGAKHFTKRYPIHLLAEAVNVLAQQLQTDFKTPVFISIVGSETDIELAEELFGMLKANNIDVEQLAGKTSLDEMVGVLDSADLVIANDSGLAHLTAARKRPLLVLFGGTVPELGFAPWRVQHEIVQNETAECRPCSHIGRSDCPLGHFDCMNGIREYHVVSAGLRLIALGDK